MPKVSEMFPSKFMKPRDVPKSGLTLTIKSVEAGTLLDRKSGEVKAVYSLNFVEPGTKPLTLNKVNAGSLAERYGDSTDDWLGKPIPLIRVLADVFGKSKWVIRVEPLEEEEAEETEDEDTNPEIPF